MHQTQLYLCVRVDGCDGLREALQATVVESGFPGFEERSWVAFFAPAKTPALIVSRLNEEINRILDIPEIRANLTSQGTEVTPLSQQAFADKLVIEIAMWRKIVSVTGAKAD